MKTLAVVCSDMHLCHTPPSCRAELGGGEWYEVMRAHIAELLLQSGTLMQEHAVPILIAGDIFDRWRSPNELVNMAIDAFSISTGKCQIYTIPGQHELPDHQIEQKHRSAYGTLVRSGRVIDLIKPTYISSPEGVRDLVVCPFPWGAAIKPLAEVWGGDSKALKVALVHSYAWEEGYSYPGASSSEHVKKYLKQLEGFDVAVFGDNHMAFHCKGKPNIFNCGHFIRRSRAEIPRRPRIGLIKEDGSVESVDLESSLDDRFVVDLEDLSVQEKGEAVFSEDDFDLDDDSIDFATSLERVAAKESPVVREGVLKVLEKARVKHES